MATFFRKHLTVIFAGLMLALVPLAIPGAVSAQDGADATAGLACGANFDLDIDGDGCEVSEDDAGRIQEIVILLVNILSVIVGIVAVIMIIYGGFKYITSGGDSGNVSTAKNTIIYAIIGLVIVALAQFIVHFVLAQVLE